MKLSRPGHLPFAALLITLAIAGCDDTLDAANSAHIEQVTPQEIERGLTSASWLMRNISAAPCGTNSSTWTFEPSGAVILATSSSSYDLEGGSECIISSGRQEGTFLVNDAGEVKIFFDGQRTRVWQPSVESSVVHFERVGDEFVLAAGPAALTTEALVIQSGQSRVFSGRSLTETVVTGLEEKRTTLTFGAPLSPGSCRATFEQEVVDVTAEGERSEARDVFEFRCRVEETGVGDWAQIILTEAPVFEASPEEPSFAENMISSTHREFDESQVDRAVFYFHLETPNRLVTRYAGCCDDRWLTAR